MGEADWWGATRQQVKHPSSHTHLSHAPLSCTFHAHQSSLPFTHTHLTHIYNMHLSHTHTHISLSHTHAHASLSHTCISLTHMHLSHTHLSHTHAHASLSHTCTHTHTHLYIDPLFQRKRQAINVGVNLTNKRSINKFRLM